MSLLFPGSTTIHKNQSSVVDGHLFFVKNLKTLRCSPELVFVFQSSIKRNNLSISLLLKGMSVFNFAIQLTFIMCQGGEHYIRWKRKEILP